MSEPKLLIRNAKAEVCDPIHVIGARRNLIFMAVQVPV